jgi:CRISPR-associated protein Cas2
MHLLVTYDVNTTTPEGRRRLRRVARICCDFGQRVQYSVFEIVVGETDLFRLRSRLLDEINPELDSLRLYQLGGSFDLVVEAHGRNRSVDFEGPLVI